MILKHHPLQSLPERIFIYDKLLGARPRYAVDPQTRYSLCVTQTPLDEEPAIWGIGSFGKGEITLTLHDISKSQADRYALSMLQVSTQRRIVKVPHFNDKAWEKARAFFESIELLVSKVIINPQTPASDCEDNFFDVILSDLCPPGVVFALPPPQFLGVICEQDDNSKGIGMFYPERVFTMCLDKRA